MQHLNSSTYTDLARAADGMGMSLVCAAHTGPASGVAVLTYDDQPHRALVADWNAAMGNADDGWTRAMPYPYTGGRNDLIVDALNAFAQRVGHAVQQGL